MISDRLTGGARFGGRERYIRDEIPAIYVPNLFGGRLILEGDQGDYRLSLEPADFPHSQFSEVDRVVEVDLSGVLAAQLHGLPGLTIELD